MYQGPQGLDSVLNYPIYDALVSAFTIPGTLNISSLVQVFQDSQAQYKVINLTISHSNYSHLYFRMLLYWVIS